MWKGSDRDYKVCKESVWTGLKDCCRWCGGVLPVGRRRWCSDSCGVVAGGNHWFSSARGFVLLRDEFVCQLCGFEGGVPKVRYRRGSPVVVGSGLEVDHIVPCLGSHDKGGCQHHFSNLRSLCPSCHKRVTKQQRQMGLFDR